MKLTSAAMLLAALHAVPALAQYKVVNPDGTVTYTDRIPAVASNQKVTALGRGGAPVAVAAGGTPAAATAGPDPASLPLDLRQAMQRHPVTLITGADCAPCDTARQMLNARGVPFTEKRVSTDEDAQALERLVGGRAIPALTIGAVPLRGYSEADWQLYLDTAGYPRQSRLPRGWQQAAASPLVERAAPAVRPAPAAPAPREEPAPAVLPTAPAPAPGSVRF